MEGATDLQYLEVPCQRQVADSVGSPSQFSQGVQDYSWTIGKGMAFYPHRSYFKFTVQLKGSNRFQLISNKPAISEQLALSENFMANMYDSMYFLGGGQNISSIVNYLPQVNQVETRINGSQAWLKSVGQSSAYTNPNFSSRVNAVSAQLGDNVFPLVDDRDGDSIETRGFTGLSLDEGKSCYRKPILPTANFDTATLTASDPTSTFIGTGTALKDSDIGSTLVFNGFSTTIVRIQNAEGGATQTINISNLNSTAIASGGVTTDWYLIQRNLTTSTESHNQLQATWFPSCLGIFQETRPLGAGDYRIQASPSANYKINAVESVQGYVSHEFLVLDVKFYAAIAKLMIPDQVQDLYLTEWQAQSKVMTTPDQNLSWTVPASTSELYVFLQSGKAGQSVLYPPSKFQAEGNAEQNLLRLQITYANVSRPQTIWQSGFTNSIGVNDVSKNLLTQLYTSSLLETDRYYNEGGSESMNDWLARGCLFCFKFSKAEFDLSTQCQLQVQYSDPTGTNDNTVTTPFPTDSRVFLVARYSRTVQITTSGGMVSAVRSLNV